MKIDRIPLVGGKPCNTRDLPFSVSPIKGNVPGNLKLEGLEKSENPLWFEDLFSRKTANLLDFSGPLVLDSKI